eukprot:TRINITY_DN43169_c0_g1_i1.p1 TRINITY_DN43169_c0_g1~~TRINITY_DN43169_c0_g1_i1.p1  ORF type:complete len:626 (+),score=132.34 TRINITY_DN43169_c0_g1_i1:45-1880(+)
MAEAAMRFGLDLPEPGAGSRPTTLDEGLALMRRLECDFLAVPLQSETGFEPFKQSTQILSTTKWCGSVVGKVTGSVDVDSSDEGAARRSEAILSRELAYAAHSTLPCVLTPALHSKLQPNLARLLAGFMQSSPFMSVWVTVPLMLPGAEDEDAAWEAWNGIRTLCGGCTRLGAVLEITEDLPPPAVLQRWRAEPVKALIVDTATFVQTEAGEYVLPQAHSEFVVSMHRHNVQVFVRGDVHPQLRVELSQDLRYYKNFVANLCAQVTQSRQERYEAPYRDHLQEIGQPLSEHLDSRSYESFEKDPVKYQKFEAAIEAALVDLRAQGVLQQRAVVAVAGAGRGSLISASLRAAERAGVQVFVYAIEKNPFAVVTLRSVHRHQGWGGCVQICEADMREWQPAELCDLLVSELLGSAGDNDLSPECIDGAQHALKPTGLSIPSSYRSFLAPVQTVKLHADLTASSDARVLETPFAVRLHSAHLLGGAQQLFSFSHPKPADSTNERYKRLSWVSEEGGLCHGFAAYFEATLYGDISISTHPEGFTSGMFSWFPMFFPLQQPVRIRRGETVEVGFWRVLGKGSMWYEWCMIRPNQTAVHNVGGKKWNCHYHVVGSAG